MFDRVFCPGKDPSELSWERLLNMGSGAARASAGAAGPFLSHRNLWQRIAGERLSTALVIAPHATWHGDLNTLFEQYWAEVPGDWDVVCLGAYYQTPPVHVAGHVFSPSDFAAVHGYAIRGRACAQLLEDSRESGTVEEQFRLMQAAGSLKIYSIWPNLVCPIGPAGVAQDAFNSFSKLGTHGRMGNQFFQVAATIGTAVRHGFRPQFPAWNSSQILREHFDQQFDVSRIAGTYNEPCFHYSPIPDTPNLDLFGFFQSPRYFHGYENLIRHYLRPSAKLQSAIETRFAALLSRPMVAIHVRRADYMGLAHAFVTLPIEYYRAAMGQFGPEYHFAVFSDDPAWCRAAFKDDGVEVISGNPGYADLYLMSACQHQIIANSSFSWWAAYLNSNPDKRVIAPNTWFGPALPENDTRDLMPSEWIRVDG